MVHPCIVHCHIIKINFKFCKYHFFQSRMERDKCRKRAGKEQPLFKVFTSGQVVHCCPVKYYVIGG